jgi:hypothetical protein
MNKVLFAVMTLVMLTSCACNGLKVRYFKSEAQTEESRPLKGFERIELLGSLDVKYEQADSFSVRVAAPVNVIKDVETRVEGNKLVVNMKGSNKFINIGVSDSDGVTIYVTSPDFIGIELKGSGDFDCKQLLDTDNLDITLKGSGDIKFHDVICDQVNVSLVGSGDVELKNVKMLRSNIDLVGSGDVKVRFNESGSVESRLTGSGDITLSGTVKNYTSNVRGSGDMHTEGLRISESKTETTTESKTNMFIK